MVLYSFESFTAPVSFIKDGYLIHHRAVATKPGDAVSPRAALLEVLEAQELKHRNLRHMSIESEIPLKIGQCEPFALSLYLLTAIKLVPSPAPMAMITT